MALDLSIPLWKGLCSKILEHRQFSQSSSQTVWQYFAIWRNSDNFIMENIRTHSNFCKYRNFTRKYRRIISHFFRAAVKFNKLMSLCYFQNCTNENVPGDLWDRVSGTVWCIFLGSPPELCPISVHVRHSSRTLSLSTFQRCAGRYGTDASRARCSGLKSAVRFPIEFRNSGTRSIKG